MKIGEIILDYIGNIRLVEMAFDRKTAKQNFENLNLVIAKHLIKIVAFNDVMNYQHHCHEVNNWLDDLNRVKWNKNQHLSKDVIWKILWDEPLGHGASAIEDCVSSLIRIFDYQTPRNDLTYSQIYEILFKVYDEICFDLSRGKVSSIQSYLAENINNSVR